MKKVSKVKRVFIITTFTILLTSCGKSALDKGGTASSSSPIVSEGACSNSIVKGRWIATTSTTVGLTFTSDCRYINDFCKSTGTYPANVISDTGTVLINVDSRAQEVPAQCLPIGSFECKYQIDRSVSPARLGVLCGKVWGTYVKE